MPKPLAIYLLLMIEVVKHRFVLSLEGDSEYCMIAGEYSTFQDTLHWMVTGSFCFFTKFSWISHKTKRYGHTEFTPLILKHLHQKKFIFAPDDSRPNHCFCTNLWLTLVAWCRRGLREEVKSSPETTRSAETITRPSSTPTPASTNTAARTIESPPIQTNVRRYVTSSLLLKAQHIVREMFIE